MSFLARYLSSLRRRPTSSSSPRRLWWSCLCTFRCSVRSLIRLDSSATWTSGEPVSPSLVACVAMISFLIVVSSGTVLLAYSNEVCRPPEGAASEARTVLARHRLPREWRSSARQAAHHPRPDLVHRPAAAD